MLLRLFGANLLGTTLVGKGVTPAGKETIRADQYF